MGNLVGIGGTLIPTVRLNAGDSSAYITTTTGNDVIANIVTNDGTQTAGYFVYNNGEDGLGYGVINDGQNGLGVFVQNSAANSTGFIVNNLLGYSTGFSVVNVGDYSNGISVVENGENSTGVSIEIHSDSAKALDISANGSNITGINIVTGEVSGQNSAINIDNTDTDAEIYGINITQSGYFPAINITNTRYYSKAVEIHNEANAEEIINIYNSSSVNEFQFRNGGEFETTGDITTHGVFSSKGAHIRADIDYTLPYTMTLTQNVWQRIDLKDVGDVSNGIILTGDSILCAYQGSINLQFEFNVANVASIEYEYRIRRNGVTLRTIKVTGASANVTRTINYVHKNVGTGYYSIEIRSISSSPGDVVFYNGYCYAKMENIW
jgi:hypothetical protein